MTTPKQIEHQRLLQELDRLEQEQRTLDLRDEAAWNAHRAKVDAIRKQIAAFLTQRETRNCADSSWLFTTQPAIDWR
jgi:hypothetical protein